VAEALSRHAQTVATIVTYHFVQPALAGPLAGLKRLDLAAFREQVTYIRRHYTPVSVFDLVRAAGTRRPCRRVRLSCPLTTGTGVIFIMCFRSWTRCRYRPCSFRSRRRCSTDRVLDVNKIQCVLAAADDVGRLVAAIERRSSDTGTRPGCRHRPSTGEKWWKPSRWDPPAVVYVKRLLQHALPEPIRRAAPRRPVPRAGVRR